MKEYLHVLSALSLGFTVGLGAFFYIKSKPMMPPGYMLQTDGYNYRWIAHQNGSVWTNYDGGTKAESIKESWKIYLWNHKAKQEQQEWENVKP